MWLAPRRVIAVAAALVAVAALTACGATHTSGSAAATRSSSTPSDTGVSSDPALVTDSPSPTPTATTAATSTAPGPTVTAPSKTVVAPSTKAPAAPAAAHALPLTLATGSATEVITVVATASTATTATLQAWTAAPGGGWLPYGPAITAHLGADGIGRASETTSRTPAGSFTLTQAFGHLTNPGTGLPYLQTTPADWWISQPGTLYNTHQHCSANCAFTQGNPNEHLYYETPYYNYAVVIDYNTAPVVQGAGSAFFLHVTDGKPTAGCVAIPQTNLTTIMRWLTPTAHPRILIGVS